VSKEQNLAGWLLDVSTCSEGVILWVKTLSTTKIVRIHDSFSPEFFAVPRKNSGKDLQRFRHILAQNHDVKSVRICEKYVKLEDHKKTKLLGISVIKPSVFKKVIQKVDEIGLFILYNTDLPIAQMYYYVKDLFPISLCEFKVEIKKDKKTGVEIMNLLSLTLNDDNEQLFYDLPPLKAIWLDVKVQQKGIRYYYDDPMAFAEISIVENDEDNVPRADGYKKRKVVINNGDEAEDIKELSRLVEKLDPDIILTQKGDEFLFPYLAARASVHRISKELFFSRQNPVSRLYLQALWKLRSLYVLWHYTKALKNTSLFLGAISLGY
jgi:DNA polymerase elongation subunit (family B)